MAACMAKCLASEFCSGGHPAAELPHPRCGYGCSEYEIERLMRDAPFSLIGEGTSEIQKRLIKQAGCWRTYRI